MGLAPGIQVKARNHFDELQRRQGRHQIFRRAAAHQFAIKLDIIGTADHHTLVAGSQTSASRSSSSSALLAVQPRLHDQEVGRDLAIVEIHRGVDAAQLNRQMRLGQAAVRAGALQGGTGVGNSQKAWIEMRGTGRSCGAAPNA
jgi:hypothetical protein